MNARKRPGASLHRPPAKQPRLTMRAPDGGNPSPGGNPANANDRLRARWVAHFAAGLKNGWSFAQGTVELVVETLFPPPAALPMYSSNQRPIKNPPPVPLLPTPPTSPSDSSGELPSVRHTSAVIPSASTASTSVTPVEVTPALRPPPEIVAVPWPSTANTQTPYPEIDKELRRHHTVRRQHKRATRNHIFAKQHKMHVQAAVAGAREELMKELYILNQKNGYSSDFTTFKGKSDFRLCKCC
ncbi:hypothetical protein B0H19DRAFT_1126266 [Mycena capillaripes]|nr:hypothetical protein B0H19DRAFT_1126266 [Mycena capillaripes]